MKTKRESRTSEKGSRFLIASINYPDKKKKRDLTKKEKRRRKCGGTHKICVALEVSVIHSNCLKSEASVIGK